MIRIPNCKSEMCNRCYLTPIIAVTNINTHKNNVVKRIAHVIKRILSVKISPQLGIWTVEKVPFVVVLGELLLDECCRGWVSSLVAALSLSHDGRGELLFMFTQSHVAGFWQ